MRTSIVLFGLLACGCATTSRPPVSSRPTEPERPIVLEFGSERIEHAVYDTSVARYRDMTFEQLAKRLPGRANDGPPPFDVSKARYYDEVVRALELNAAEKALLARRGFVSVNHADNVSMAMVYYNVYSRDLPILVTTDSILHALHRTYNTQLHALEGQVLRSVLEEVLESSHARLAKEARAVSDSSLRQSLEDVDLYLTVARNLLAGVAASTSDRPSVASVLGKDDDAARLLKSIASLEMQSPDSRTSIYGGERAIDFSQFRPRGHYATAPVMQSYFRTMMWMGRADTGWVLSSYDEGSGLRVDAARERLNAAVLTRLVADSGKYGNFASMSRAIDFLVGRSDSVSVGEMIGWLDRAGAKSIADLARLEVRDKLAREARSVAPQRIRSQVLLHDPPDSRGRQPPAVFQAFGQRFVLDSFVLARTVYDTISFRGEKPKRTLPSGLDVMAALGNDEAVSLLEPELRRFGYAANLLAARDVVQARTEKHWNASLYDTWLDALRRLDEVPPKQAPRVMQSRAWQHKQLQTQLASWAELRHDTLLYATQSYGTLACEYPAGFVEPYPAFYARLNDLARTADRLWEVSDFATDDFRAQWPREVLMKASREVWSHFANVTKQLELLAQKELRHEPFTEEEQRFLKSVMTLRSRGCGDPYFDGWYPGLYFGGEAAKLKPVVADVHTDPWGQRALQVGVGEASYLVTVVDSGPELSVFVGPAYTYYEFTQPVEERMTDASWTQRIGKLPLPRPDWTESFQAPSSHRSLPFDRTLEADRHRGGSEGSHGERRFPK